MDLVASHFSAAASNATAKTRLNRGGGCYILRRRCRRIVSQMRSLLKTPRVGVSRSTKGYLWSFRDRRHCIGSRRSKMR